MASGASAVITLSGDIGPVYGAQVKAVLTSFAPGCHVVELALNLPSHQVTESAFLLWHMARRFPPGTIHLAIVDPGVGGSRAPLAVACDGGTWLVGPDNGVLFPLAKALGVVAVYRLLPERVTGQSPSPTFEGRDLFAPAAARLAGGESGEALGVRAMLSPLELPSARRGRNRVQGVVLHVDSFGNLITNIPTAWAPAPGTRLTLRLARRSPTSLRRVRTYSELGRGELGVIGSSFDMLEISVRESSAAQRLHVRAGGRVDIRWASRPRSKSARTG